MGRSLLKRQDFKRFCPNGGCMEGNQAKYSPSAAHISNGHPMLVKYLSCHSECRVSRKITFSFPLIIYRISSKLNINKSVPGSEFTVQKLLQIGSAQDVDRDF